MNGWNVVRLADVAATPWRNGGGVTRELLTWPDAANWRVRLSVAEVEKDGPFSVFEGVQRVFAVLQGAGVRLRVEGREHLLTAADAPLHFDGAARVDCTLVNGATRDFNLMTRGGRATMERVAGTWSGHADAMSLIAVCASGMRATAVFGNEEVLLEPQALAWRILDGAGPVQVSARDALWMDIKP